MSRSPQITVPKEHERGEPPWGKITLIVALLALMLVVAYGITTVNTGEVGTGIGSESAIAAENPELNLFRRYNDAAQKRAEMTFLANNPEIMSLQRYADLQAAQREATFLAQNPELMTVRRYAAQINQHVDAAFLAQNPEIKIFRHFVDSQE